MDEQETVNEEEPQPPTSLSPSTYSAPPLPLTPDGSPAAPNRKLNEAERAALAPISLSPDLREKHIFLTVRPGDDQAAYMQKRSIGWVMRLEQLAEESEDPGQQAKIYKDLVRFSILTRPADPSNGKGGKPSKSGDPGPKEVHLHQHHHEHDHHEIPELAGISTEDLADLTSAFQARIAAARSDPRRFMNAQEARAFEQVASRVHPTHSQTSNANDVIDVESTPTESAEEED